ncbi:MAG TPA: STAS domain-containing protein [Acidimicrobiales bacterium]|jgi:anti-anti-sigma factor|nr:STAS domain-containing protein [Acidimicrobiales bacterium]
MADAPADGILIEVQDGGDDTVVRLIGELDLQSAPRVRTAMASVHGGHTDRVVVDLEGLSYMDSVGIGLLVSSRQRLESEGRHLSLRNPAPPIRRLLQITGLEDYLGLER